MLAGRLLAIWALDDAPETHWHPGYYLPSVGAPLVAAATSATFGYVSLARLLFGFGIISWVLIGGILLHHLVGQQRLPKPLMPTMAILIAPPVVAGNAWFAINGGRVDAIALGLAGYALLMATTQLGLIAAYRTVPFGPGWWSYSFPYAATATNAVIWLGAEHAPHQSVWTYLLLAAITAFIGIPRRPHDYRPGTPPVPCASLDHHDAASDPSARAGRSHRNGAPVTARGARSRLAGPQLVCSMTSMTR